MSWKDVDIHKPRCVSHECQRKDTCFYYTAFKIGNYKNVKYVERDPIFCEEYSEIEIF